MYKTYKAFEKSFPRHYLGTDGIELEEYALVRHGRWIENRRGFLECSECKFERIYIPLLEELNYCPGCGAKMRGAA